VGAFECSVFILAAVASCSKGGGRRPEEPTTIATVGHDVREILPVGGRIYLVEPKAITELVGGKPRVVAEVPGLVVGAATEGDSLYWSEGEPSEIHRVRAGGERTTINGGGWIAVRGVTLVRTLPELTLSDLDGGNPRVIPEVRPFGAIVVDDDFIYWNKVGAWVRVNRRGGDEGQLVAGPSSSPHCPARIEGRFLYWISAQGGGLYRAPLEGEDEAELLVPRTRYFTALGGVLYWVDGDRQAVYRSAPTGTGSPTVVVRGRHNIDIIATDGRSLYWIEDTRLLSLQLPAASSPARPVNP